MSAAAPAPSSAPSPAQPSLKARALRALAAREYGRVELERKLAAYAPSAPELQTLLDDLQAKGFISDERAVASLLNRRAEKLGTQRLLHELRQKGFDTDLIAAQAAFLQETEEMRARNMWQKKFGSAPNTEQEKAKQLRFLASRGFSSTLVYALMRDVLAGKTGNEEWRSANESD